MPGVPVMAKDIFHCGRARAAWGWGRKFCPGQFCSLCVKRQEILWKDPVWSGWVGEMDPWGTKDRLSFVREINGECQN